MVGIVGARTTGAMDIVVANNADSGNGTLRQAIQFNESLGGGNRILFSNIVTGTITLTNVLGQLVITKDVTIVGPGANVLTISGNAYNRVFDLTNAMVNISGLTISRGYAINGDAGGIYVRAGCNLSLSNCTISGNYAAYGGGIYILSAATAKLASCTVFGNGATGGAGLYCAGTLAMTNRTIAGNSAAEAQGGGLLGFGSSTIVNCTISGNSAMYVGGGVYGSAIVRNTIIAGNKGSLGSPAPDCSGVFTSQGFNLIGALDGSSGWGALGDQVGTTSSYLDPKLGPLQDNGGPSFTMAPQIGSPVVDQGNSSGTFTDQRGRPRPHTNDYVGSIPLGGDRSDIGAVELSPILVTTASDSGAGSLRQNILLAGSVESTITFASNVVGTITLTNGALGISKNVSIVGPGARVLTLDANANGHIFEVLSGNASISGLTLANGRYVGTPGGVEQNGAQARGGGIFNQATLALNDCILSNNVVIGGQGGPTASGFAGGGGNGFGGAIANIGTLAMTNCYLVASSATGGTGGAATGGGFAGSGGQAYGGGVYSSGPLTLVRCALAMSIASGGSGGGGIGSGSGGGIYNDADVTMLTCTVASNSASGGGNGFGGGIYHNGTTLTIRASTIAGNQADYGGGLFGSAAADCGDAILAYNAAGTGPDCSGTINSSDYNLIQNTSGATITGATTHNITGQNPLLSALADNGGLTPTLATLAGSPVRDQGKNLGPATDQRGAPRPFDFPSIPNAAGGDGSDMGAFEAGSPQLAIQKSGSAAVLSWPSYYGGFTVQSVTNVSLSNAWTAVAGTPVVSGNQYVFTNGPLTGNKFYRLEGN
jgi:parallel beta-helix repeat protein